MKDLIRIASVLFGILVVAAVMMILGRQNNDLDTSAHSFGPSGYAGLAELFRQNGYDVRILGEIRFTAPQDALLIAIRPSGPSSGSPTEIADRVKRHVQNGGRAIVGAVQKDFANASISAQTPRSVKGILTQGETKTVNVTDYAAGWSFVDAEEIPIVAPAAGNDPFISFGALGKGR